MDYFGAIDQGTTSTRFIVYDEEHKQVTQHQIEIKQYLNQPGYVEHNPEEIWRSVVDCVNGVSKDFDISLLSSIGITNQRETTLAWRKSTGEHLHNAIVWQDTRTQDICDEIQTFNELKDEFDKTKLRGEYSHMNQFKFDANDIKAFSILGASVGQKWEQIQDQFKTLVKKFHPDINLGNKEYEEKLKLITLAYTQLKNTYKEKIDT